MSSFRKYLPKLERVARFYPSYESEGVRISALSSAGDTCSVIAFDDSCSSVPPRRLDFTKVGIKVYKLSQYEEAFEELKKGSVSKAVFEIGA